MNKETLKKLYFFYLFKWFNSFFVVVLFVKVDGIKNNHEKILEANKANEAGEKCYKLFNSETCGTKCIETFGYNCPWKSDRRDLYKDIDDNSKDNKFCRNKFGFSRECL
jgi:hypothetical protein